MAEPDGRLGPSEARFRVLAYAVQSMAPAGFAVPRSPFPLPIPPRCESGRYHHRCPEGHQHATIIAMIATNVSVIEFNPS